MGEYGCVVELLLADVVISQLAGFFESAAYAGAILCHIGVLSFDVPVVLFRVVAGRGQERTVSRH